MESVASAYGWNHQMLLAQVVRKLKGAAKQWFDCNLETITTWADFKRKLMYSFPSTFDQADIHAALAGRKKGKDETYESYESHFTKR